MEKSSFILKDLTLALARLKEVLLLEATEVNQDAAIQRFEFTFELSWKFMQAILRENANDAYGVKTIFREAARLRLIDDPLPWFEFLKERNQTTHTYDIDQAKRIYAKLSDFVPLVEQLVERGKSSTKPIDSI